MGHTAVSAIQASSVTFRFGNKEPKRIAVILQLLTEGDLSNKSNPQMRTKDYRKDMMMIRSVDRLSRCKQIIDGK